MSSIKVCGNSIGEIVQACLKLMTDVEEEDDWATDDDPAVSSQCSISFCNVRSF